MRQLFRFIFIVGAFFWIFAGSIGIAMSVSKPTQTISDIIGNIMGVILMLSVLVGFFVAARWCNKGEAFDIKKDSLYVLKNMGIFVLVYFGLGLIVRLSYECKKFFSF